MIQVVTIYLFLLLSRIKWKSYYKVTRLIWTCNHRYWFFSFLKKTNQQTLIIDYHSYFRLLLFFFSTNLIRIFSTTTFSTFDITFSITSCSLQLNAHQSLLKIFFLLLKKFQQSLPYSALSCHYGFFFREFKLIRKSWSTISTFTSTTFANLSVWLLTRLYLTRNYLKKNKLNRMFVYFYWNFFSFFFKFEIFLRSMKFENIINDEIFDWSIRPINWFLSKCTIFLEWRFL